MPSMLPSRAGARPTLETCLGVRWVSLSRSFTACGEMCREGHGWSPWNKRVTFWRLVFGALWSSVMARFWLGVSFSLHSDGLVWLDNLLVDV